jgi:F-type H+-transporting ATPase subunit delta
VKSSVIARRYAKALILIGKEDGQAETYREELNSVIEVLDSNPAFEDIVDNPLFDSAKRTKLFTSVLNAMEMSKVMKTFLNLIFSKQRFNQIRSISEHYNKLADELKGVVQADLVSATALSSDTYEQIRQALAKMTGKEVLLQTHQDPEIIGGIVTKIGDLVLDGSIKTQLKNMRESLKRGESV